MTKEVKVLASQTVYYTYSIEVPDSYEIEEYVYENLRNCDENFAGLDTPIEIFDYGEINVDDIREYK